MERNWECYRQRYFPLSRRVHRVGVAELSILDPVFEKIRECDQRIC
jgi:hypothetical protein